jgi:hypothetical protein
MLTIGAIIRGVQCPRQAVYMGTSLKPVEVKQKIKANNIYV